MPPPANPAPHPYRDPRQVPSRTPATRTCEASVYRSSQHYRGHVIDVTCFTLDGRIAYQYSVRVTATNVLRYEDSCANGTYRSDQAALDEAFSAARGWVERYPLQWPFTVPTVEPT